jgi:steroid 5-alpha reductase family enzyme
MLIMFLVASIPMIDKRSVERRPEYEAHMARVSGFVPWFPKTGA